MKNKLIKSFLDLKQNKIYSLKYSMKDDCIRIFESLSAKGIIHDHNGYLVYPTDDYIFMATIDNSIKFNYNIGYIENSNNSYPIKIFSKDV